MTSSPTVLVLEDSKMSETLCDYYRDFGFEACYFEIPDSAIDALKTARLDFDVAIVDIWLNWPGEGQLDPRAGITVLKKMLAIHSALPIIMITAHSDEPGVNYREECRTLGAFGFVAKGTPTFWNDLNALIYKGAVQSISQRLGVDSQALSRDTFVASSQAQEQLLNRYRTVVEFGREVGVADI